MYKRQVNDFVNAGEKLEIPLLEIDESVEREQVDYLRSIKEKRDNGAVRRHLAALAQAAAGPDNLMPRLLDCARVYATVGEMSEALRGVFGEYRERPFF